MKYSDCISITMAALNYMLEYGWSFSNNENFNFMDLKLNERGFVLCEESRFGVDLSYGIEQVPVSPSYVISMLFDGGYDDEIGIIKNHFITSVVRKLSDSQINNQVSFIEVVKLIDKMRDNVWSTGKMSSSITDINYLRFRKILNRVKRDEYVILNNQVIGLKNLSYNTLTNIRNEKTEIARKIERMYQVEILLNKYCKTMVLGTQYGIDFDDVDYLDVSDKLDEIDLSKHIVNWNDFCNNIKLLNEREIVLANEYWERNKGHYRNVKLTALGLDEMSLPGTPLVYKQYMR